METMTLKPFGEVSDAQLDKGLEKVHYPKWDGSKKAKILDSFFISQKEPKLNTKKEPYVPMQLCLKYEIESLAEPVTVRYGTAHQYSNPLNYYLKLTAPLSHMARIFLMLHDRKPDLKLMDGKKPVLSLFRQSLIGMVVSLRCIEVPNPTTGEIGLKPMIERFE